MCETVAYIAGLFDGEGSAFISMPKSRDGLRRPKLTAKVAQADRMVLDWIKTEVGCGNVQAKSDGRPNVVFDYVATHRSARIFLTLIEPHLRVKKSKVTELLDLCGREASPHRLAARI